MKNSELIALIVERIKSSIEESKALWSGKKDINTRFFYIDDLLPEEIATQIYEEFPQNFNDWHQRDTFREKKKTFAKLDQTSKLINDVTDALQSPEVVDLITQVTGISGLEGDPELYAAGLSMMAKDDFLNPHIDNSHDAKRGRYRRLNILYYVSKEWKQEYGGNLELWDEKVENPIEIFSKFNRLVIMETNKASWHSVNKINVDKNRFCVSNYYFSKASPEDHDYYHVTSFIGRPDQMLRRGIGRVDNFLRQKVATVLGISRGKKLGRGK